MSKSNKLSIISDRIDHLVANLQLYSDRSIQLVPTMGALHQGHAALIRSAQSEASSFVVVSIFVNPIQFNSSQDLDSYPQQLDRDLEFCNRLGVDLVFVPGRDEMYPKADICLIKAPAQLANELEGKSRPGHFDGMLTVVCKLLNIIQPNCVYFGQKDYQQLLLVSRMVEDLNLSRRLRVCSVPTAREADGLPLSSRNVRLDSRRRRLLAGTMCEILGEAKQTLESLDAGALPYAVDSKEMLDLVMFSSMTASQTIGEVLVDQSEPNGATKLDRSQEFEVDYLELRCAEDLSCVSFDHDSNLFDCQHHCCADRLFCDPKSSAKLETRLLISAIVTGVRLLDNVALALNSR